MMLLHLELLIAVLGGSLLSSSNADISELTTLKERALARYGAALIHKSFSISSSDFDGCWVDTYDRGIGTLPSYRPCGNDDYTDFGLTCTEKLGRGGCEWYTPWECNTFNKDPYCSDSDRDYEDLLCYKKPEYGYECLLTVCETSCPAAILGSEDCGLFCSNPSGNCVTEVLAKIFTAGKFASTFVTIAGLPSAGLAGVVKAAATSAATNLFSSQFADKPRPDPRWLSESCNPNPGAVYSRRITRLVPELLTDLTDVFRGISNMASAANDRRVGTMKSDLVKVMKTVVPEARANKIAEAAFSLYNERVALEFMVINNGAEGIDCLLERTAHRWSSWYSSSSPAENPVGFFKTAVREGSAFDPLGLYALLDEFLLEICEVDPIPKHVGDGNNVVCSQNSVPVNDGLSNDGFGYCKCDPGWTGIDCSSPPECVDNSWCDVDQVCNKDFECEEYPCYATFGDIPSATITAPFGRKGLVPDFADEFCTNLQNEELKVIQDPAPGSHIEASNMPYTITMKLLNYTSGKKDPVIEAHASASFTLEPPKPVIYGPSVLRAVTDIGECMYTMPAIVGTFATLSPSDKVDVSQEPQAGTLLPPGDHVVTVWAIDQEFEHLKSSYNPTLHVAVRDPEVSCTPESVTIEISESLQCTAAMVDTKHIMEVSSPCAVEVSQLPKIGTSMVPGLYNTGLTATNLDEPEVTHTCGVNVCVVDRPQFDFFPLDAHITTKDSRGAQFLGVPTSTCCVKERCMNTTVEYKDSSFQATETCGVWLVRRSWTLTSQGTCDNLSASRVQLIYIKDISPPIWTSMLPDVTIDFLASYGPDATGFPTAVDALDSTEDFANLSSYPVQVSYQDEVAHDPSSCEALAVVSRTWETKDACGNRATHVQFISIRHPRSSLSAPLFGLASGYHVYAGTDLDIHHSAVSGDIAASGRPYIKDVKMHGTCPGNSYSVVAQQCPKLDRVDTGTGYMRKIKCPKKERCPKDDAECSLRSERKAYGLEALKSDFVQFDHDFDAANAALVKTSKKIQSLTANSVDLRAGPTKKECSNPALPCEAIAYNNVSSSSDFVGSDQMYNFFFINASDLLTTDQSKTLQVYSPGGYTFITVHGNVFDYLGKGPKHSKGTRGSKAPDEDPSFKSLALDGLSTNFVLFNAPDFAAVPKKHKHRYIWGNFSGSLLATNKEFSPRLNDFVMTGQLLTTGSLHVKDSVFSCGLFAADTTCRN